MKTDLKNTIVQLISPDPMNFVKQLFASLKALFNRNSNSVQAHQHFAEETLPDKSGEGSDDENGKSRSVTEPPSVASVKILPTPNG